MSSAPDSSVGARPTARQPSGPESEERDTVPTGPAPHSTLPPVTPASVLPSTESPAPSAAPSEDAPSSPSDSESNTLHSASHPGSSNQPHWDERRILHLEREFDQLSAHSRLLAKRVDDLSDRLRIVLSLAVLALIAAALAWTLRA